MTKRVAVPCKSLDGRDVDSQRRSALPERSMTEDCASRTIGSIDVAVCTSADASRRILDAAAGQRPLMVCFANAHSVNLAARDLRFRSAMREALVLNDGVGVDLASRLLWGDPFPENLNGTDLVPAMLAGASSPLRLFLIGGRPGVAKRAGDALAALNPALRIVGTRDGYFDESSESAQIAALLAAEAQLVLVAMGQPLQEVWAQRHWRSLPGPCVCVGALFDFLAEELPRAPGWIRQLRLEWAYRLSREPARLASRYLLGNPAFVARVVCQRLGRG